MRIDRLTASSSTSSVHARPTPQMLRFLFQDGHPALSRRLRSTRPHLRLLHRPGGRPGPPPSLSPSRSTPDPPSDPPVRVSSPQSPLPKASSVTSISTPSGRTSPSGGSLRRLQPLQASQCGEDNVNWLHACNDSEGDVFDFQRISISYGINSSLDCYLPLVSIAWRTIESMKVTVVCWYSCVKRTELP